MLSIFQRRQLPERGFAGTTKSRGYLTVVREIAIPKKDDARNEDDSLGKREGGHCVAWPMYGHNAALLLAHLMK